MTIFDIMGPVMVGPSSSHTAGAAPSRRISRRLSGVAPAQAGLLLLGSFEAAGAGRRKARALAAEVVSTEPRAPQLPQSFELAREAGMDLTLGKTTLKGVHPNSVLVRATAPDGHVLEVVASSLGGGRVKVCSIDGLEASFSGELPTLIIRNRDKPGMVAEVTSALSRHAVNIAAMQLYRDMRGGLAVMVLESDQSIPAAAVAELRACPGVVRLVYLDLEGAE